MIPAGVISAASGASASGGDGPGGGDSGSHAALIGECGEFPEPVECAFVDTGLYSNGDISIVANIDDVKWEIRNYSDLSSPIKYTTGRSGLTEFPWDESLVWETYGLGLEPAPTVTEVIP